MATRIKKLSTRNNSTKMESVPCEQISNSTSRPVSYSNNSRCRFPILRVPTELRLEIFEYALESCSTNREHTPLLLAFSNHFLYEEALEAYKKSYTLTWTNEETFNKRNIFTDLRYIKHLNILLPVKFRGQKLTMQNNLKSIHIDISLDYHNLDSPDYHDDRLSYGPWASLQSIMRDLLIASTAGIKVVKVTGLYSTNDDRISGFSERLENGKVQFGFTKFTLGVEPTVEIEGDRFTVTWKHEGEGFREIKRLI